MGVKIIAKQDFKQSIKPLLKKYKSMANDYNALLDELKENPYLGVSLGHGMRKVRMQISSKGKGLGETQNLQITFDAQPA